MKIKQAGVDGVLMWTQDTPYQINARQMYELGLVDIPVITNATLVNASMRDLLDGAWVGQGNWYTGCDFVTSNPDPYIAEFVQKYEAKYNVEPLSLIHI